MRVRRLAAIVAAVLVALLAGCAPAPAPPSMAEVLDAPAFAQRRDAAKAEMRSMSESLSVGSGAVVAGRAESTYCEEGQNNWKVHDGYRFKCTVRQITYLAWDGEFQPQQVKIEELVAARCPVLVLTRPEGDPWPGMFLSGPQYSCGNEVNVGMSWAGSRSLDPKKLDRACGGGYVKCGPGDETSEIYAEVSKHDWFVQMGVGVEYYKEVVNP